MELVRVCRLDLIPPGELKHFVIEETEVMVINLGGQWHCLAARCTHAGAPLVEGEIQGDILICPWHYSHFRIGDGSVVQGPAEKPLVVYKHLIGDNTLFIEL